MSNQKTVCHSLFQIYLLSERTIYIESHKGKFLSTLFLPLFKKHSYLALMKF